jgi:hypothetical protein
MPGAPRQVQDSNDFKMVDPFFSERFDTAFAFPIRRTAEDLKFHFGISSLGHGGRRYPPYAFTEQGIAMLSGVLPSPPAVQVNVASRAGPFAFTEQGLAMLSSVLRSQRAVRVNIEIIRAFVRLRRLLQGHADVARKIEELEQEHDGQFKAVFDAIHELMTSPARKRGEIGFHAIPRQSRIL